MGTKIIPNNIDVRGESKTQQIQLDTTASAPSHNEGLLYWDQTNKTLAMFNDCSDCTLQVGQEIWIRVYNNTGSDITNGEVCYLNGVNGGFPTIALARADSGDTCLSTLGFATHTISNGGYGYLTRIGTVRDLDTSGCTAGDIIYLSETTAGSYTKTKPESPNYIITLGNCGVVDASTGTIEVQISIGSNTESTINIYNGSILEDVALGVSSDGATVTFSLQKNGGGDLSLFFDGEFYKYDSTPAQTVGLTSGTDTVPQINYIYIPESTRTLTANTTGFPTDVEYAKIAKCILKSASTTATDGAFKLYDRTTHLYDGDNNTGHLTHIDDWIMCQYAMWCSGAELTPTVGTSIFDVAVSSGQVMKLHREVSDAIDTSTGDYVYIVNDSTTPYNKVADLTGVLTDSEGVSLSGRYYSLIFYLVKNYDTGNDKLFCNLPSGSYNSSDGVTEDVEGYANYNIERDYRNSAILLARLDVRNQGGTTFTIVENTDLRGLFPSTSAGGGGGSSGSTFSDAVFRIQDNGDATKQLAFEASGISTGTTRTVTVPDSDVSLYKHNITTATPTVNDDSDDGYAPFSRWINTSTNKEYICTDSTVGAAVWTETTAGAAGGESNTASNVGTAGVGVYKQKAGVDLEFKNINAGSTKVIIADDTTNDEIDIDVDGGKILDGEVTGNGIVAKTASETYTNRTITGTSDEVDVSDGDGVSDNPTIGLADNAQMPGTEGINLAGGTTLQQPGTPVEGDLRKNTTENQVEYYNGSAWVYLDNSDITTLDIDGGTDIGGDLADADLVIVDDGASGTNRKSALSRFWTYISGKLSALTEKASPVAGDFVFGYDTTGATTKKFDVDNFLGGGGGGLTWSKITASTTASSDNGYLIDPASATTLTLPTSPSAGDTIGVKAVDLDYAITVARNGSNIEGIAEDLSVDIEGAGFSLVYVDATTGWTIVTEISNTSGSLDIEYNFGICQGRLTLESGVPVSTTDQTAKTSVYFTPYNGNKLALYDGSSAWSIYSFAELTLSLSGLTANTNYDIFCYDNSGTLTLSATAWTSDTARVTAITTQDGIKVKTGATNYRYLGTIRTTSTTGQCEISFGYTPAAGGSQPKMFVYNEYNKVPATFRILDSTDSWSYTTAAWRSANASGTGSGAYNRFAFINGNDLTVNSIGFMMAQATAGNLMGSSLAVDSTTAFTGLNVPVTAVGSSYNICLPSHLDYVAGIGYHYIQMLEWGGTGGSFYGDAGLPSKYQSGSSHQTTM